MAYAKGARYPKCDLLEQSNVESYGFIDAVVISYLFAHFLLSIIVFCASVSYMKEYLNFKDKAVLDKTYAFIKRVLPSVKWIFILSISIIIGGITVNIYANSGAPESFAEEETNYSDNNCNVYGINLRGDVVTYNNNESLNDNGVIIKDQTSSESVDWTINKAQENENVNAIVIEVDSYGGSPVGGEEIANSIKASKKPVIAFIREVGASAAYWAVSSADKIYASKNSSVGSIGVTQSYLSKVDKNQKDGYTYVELNSGKFKDTGSPDKYLSYDERSLLMRDINILYKNFVEAVAENRGLTVEKVKSFADGSTVMGESAKKLGMIDEIGGLKDVENYLEGQTGAKTNICWQ